MAKRTQEMKVWLTKEESDRIHEKMAEAGIQNQSAFVRKMVLDGICVKLDLGDSIKSAETRMQEIAVLKTHILNYSKTRDVYVEYRKSGYSRKFFEEHRESITIHKAAKDAFNALGLKKLPRVILIFNKTV